MSKSKTFFFFFPYRKITHLNFWVWNLKKKKTLKTNEGEKNLVCFLTGNYFLSYKLNASTHNLLPLFLYQGGCKELQTSAISLHKSCHLFLGARLLLKHYLYDIAVKKGCSCHLKNSSMTDLLEYHYRMIVHHL